MGDQDTPQSTLSEEQNNYFLELSDAELKFDGISKSKLTSVFYDESNTQVFSIHSGDVTEVVVKSPEEKFCHSFQMAEKGRVSSIKFSPDQKVIAVQRTQNSIDLLLFSGGRVVKEFTQEFKVPKVVVLSFMWTALTELTVVTDQFVSLLKIDTQNFKIKTLQTISFYINWCVYYHPICLLLVSVGQMNTMHLLQIKQSQILKRVKFDVESEASSKLRKPFISNTNVVLGVLYNQPRILVISNNTSQAEIIVYTVIKLSSAKKTHILRLNQSGRFAINLVDNLIIVHNQVTKLSLVFDITDAEFQGSVSYQVVVVDSKSIRPLKEVGSTDNSVTPPKISELYSTSWITFQPNIVMDVKVGCLWYLKLNLAGFCRAMSTKIAIVQFLLLRTNSKMVIAQVFNDLMESESHDLEELSIIFDLINAIYRSYLEVEMRSQLSLPASMSSKAEEDPVVEFRTVLNQQFIYSNVFLKLADKLSRNPVWKQAKFLNWALLEYIRSLTDFQIPIQHCLYDLLINSLVMNGEYYQLHQLLQYHAISDSKPLACLLLSLENLYPAAPQLAIDMLERLGSAKEEIIEILLSKNQVLSALRYAKSRPSPHDRIVAAKYLEVAKAAGDETVYYSILSDFNLKCSLTNGKLTASENPRM